MKKHREAGVSFSQRDTLVEYARDIILLLTEDGTIVEANLAAEIEYGYTRQELRQMTIFQLRVKDSPSLISFQMQKAAAKDILFETYHGRKDGSLFPVEVNSRRVELEGKKYLLSVVRNITQRKETETLLKETQDCSYLVNKVALHLLQEKPTEEVLQMICDGLVDIFHLRLAWIGVKEADGSVSVRSFAGPASDYVKTLVMRWDDTPEGRGPTGRSIRLGKPQVTIIGKADGYIWRSMALQYQMAASAVVPLIWRNCILGALAMYSQEEHYFSEDRVQHMERVADQIGIVLSAAEHRRQLKLLTAAVESAANSIIVLNHEGEIQWINPAFSRLTGYKDSELLHANIFTVMNTLESSMYRAIFQCLSQGIGWEGEIISRRKEGSLYHAEVMLSPVPGDGGKIENVIAVMQDISRRKFMEEKVGQSLEYHIRLFEEFPSLIWRSDASGRCVYFNKKWLNFTGKTLEEEKGDGWVNGVHPEDVGFCIETYQKHFEQRQPFQMDYRLRRYDGEYRWITDIGIPFYDMEEAFAGYLGSCYDITETRQAQQEKLEAVQRAERAERLASLGTLTAGITHEINQPLHSLKITVDGILYWHKRGKSADMAKVMESLEKISGYADRMDNIIKHMRSIIKGNYSTEKACCNWNAAVYGALELLGSQLTAHGIQICQQLGDPPPNVSGDVRQLEEVVINLLVNAMQALERIPHGPKKIQIRTYVKEGAVLEIADNGPGIHQSVKDKIFEPFITTKQTGEGMGLGLSIVHAIVASHRGRIELPDSQEGAVFRIILPLAAGND